MEDPSDKARLRNAAVDMHPRYEDDLYSWSVEQARLLRQGRAAEVDAKNIAEELDDVGNEQYDKLESALRIVLLHLLKWDYQHERRSRSWWSSVTVQRNHVRRVLHKNPGLKPRIPEALRAAFEDARVEAVAETRLPLERLPSDCPYSWDEIMDRPIQWPPGA